MSDTLPTPPPKMRSENTCFGSGYVQVNWWIPSEYSEADIKDLRAWLALIDRRLSRWQPTPPPPEAKQ